jgi:glycosyltransferase involved in cell wall biosynthesis
VVADSEATRRDLIERLHTPPERITVAYPGRDPSFAPVRDPGLLGGVLKRYRITFPYVLYVGTLHPRKNLLTMLDAMAELVRRGFDLHWVVAGKKGWLYEPLFARLRQLGLEQRVHVVGYVPDTDLPALLSGASAFVLPSLYEGFGFPVLEAMACGAAVLCSNASSLPEVAGDAAVLLDPGDIRQWTEALFRVLQDEALRRGMIERGVKQAARFSWAACAEAVLGGLEQVGRA